MSKTGWDDIVQRSDQDKFPAAYTGPSDEAAGLRAQLAAIKQQFVAEKERLAVAKEFSEIGSDGYGGGPRITGDWRVAAERFLEALERMAPATAWTPPAEVRAATVLGEEIKAASKRIAESLDGVAQAIRAHTRAACTPGTD